MYIHKKIQKSVEKSHKKRPNNYIVMGAVSNLWDSGLAYMPV